MACKTSFGGTVCQFTIVRLFLNPVRQLHFNYLPPMTRWWVTYCEYLQSGCHGIASQGHTSTLHEPTRWDLNRISIAQALQIHATYNLKKNIKEDFIDIVIKMLNLVWVYVLHKVHFRLCMACMEGRNSTECCCIHFKWCICGMYYRNERLRLHSDPVIEKFGLVLDSVAVWPIGWFWFVCLMWDL